MPESIQKDQRGKIKITHKNVFAALSIAVGGSAVAGLYFAATYPDQHNQIPAKPLSVGGYAESHGSIGQIGLLPAQQGTYIRNKAQLDAAIEDCTKNPDTCDPNIKEFIEVIEQTKKIPNKLTQVEIINSYLDNVIAYDFKEANGDQANTFDHNLVYVLKNKRAICDEFAQLKLYALEKLGFNEDDVRLLAERVYFNGSRLVEGHAVALVRVDNNVWVMNLRWHDHNPIKTEALLSGSDAKISYETATSLVLRETTMESAALQTNISEQSLWDHGTIFSTGYFLPSFSFNSNEAAYYDASKPNKDLSNVPEESRLATRKNYVILTQEALKTSGLMPLMIAAVEKNYTVVTAVPQQKKQAQYSSTKNIWKPVFGPR